VQFRHVELATAGFVLGDVRLVDAESIREILLPEVSFSAQLPQSLPKKNALAIQGGLIHTRDSSRHDIAAQIGIYYPGTGYAAS
jgi:tryptophanase